MNALAQLAEAMEHAPTAQHLGDDELPWIASRSMGVQTKLYVAKVSEGLWILRNRFDPGVELQTHKHTGQVYAFTTAGAWGYRESEYMNTAGSFLYEPAGSIHTLYTPEDNTEVTDVFFAIYGANLNMDADGAIDSVTDAESVLGYYLHECTKLGIDKPAVLTD
ncbi:MAG: 2,4'-dihydroxyacetophenone dioxygenase family protein [Actinomycetota bacterium]